MARLHLALQALVVGRTVGLPVRGRVGGRRRQGGEQQEQAGVAQGAPPAPQDATGAGRQRSRPSQGTGTPMRMAFATIVAGVP